MPLNEPDQAWRHNMLVLLTGFGIIGLGVVVLLATWPKPIDVCDTPARYEAMRAGADCFTPPRY